MEGRGSTARCFAEVHGREPKEAPVLILVNCFVAGTVSTQAALKEPA